MPTDPALLAYERFAAIYNDFNAANDYEMWLGALLPELERFGLRHGSVLDVGCGTGRTFAPLLRRGWRVRGCDLSPAMIEVARTEGGDEVELAVADMRSLPVWDRFELVLCLNDSINYLLGDGDLERALAAMRGNLAGDGLLLFDCNSSSMFETAYTDAVESVESEGGSWTWRGLGETPGSPGVYTVRIEGTGIEPILNRERHYSSAVVEAALARAGLRCLAVLGQQESEGRVHLAEPADEARDSKILYVAAPA